MRLTAILLLLISISLACQKNISPRTDHIQVPPPREEPVQKLAVEAARKIQSALKEQGSSTIQFDRLQSNDIFPPDAFTYFENALAAQLAAADIQRRSGEWKLQGALSKEEGSVVFSFRLLMDEQLISSDSARIPDDERLQVTLSQFPKLADSQHEGHTSHREMQVPTPLAELNQIPLDLAENCSSTEGSCTLLILYPTKLVERNWNDGTEKEIGLDITAERSRAPSGKILKNGDTLFIVSNQLAIPLAFDRNLQKIRVDFPARYPQAERGLNTYVLADGRFFDFEEFGVNGLAVIDIKNHIAVADQGKLVSTDHPVGGALEVSLPYIYASAPTLFGQYSDSVQKFTYADGLLRFERSQTIDGSVYDITITDLNRDQQREMLLTVVNRRGIFIEVHEPF